MCNDVSKCWARPYDALQLRIGWQCTGQAGLAARDKLPVQVRLAAQDRLAIQDRPAGLAAQVRLAQSRSVKAMQFRARLAVQVRG